MSHLPDDQSKTLERLRREHLKLDQQVQLLESHKWLSPEDEVEMKRLKRLKLAKKDQIRHIAAEV